MQVPADDLLKYHCPRWHELPEIELYVDQVVTMLQSNLITLMKDKDVPVVTASMINNYVKQGVLEAPVKKKYNKKHLAYLFVICMFKRMMSISEIGESINIIQKVYSPEDAYNLFCDEIEKALKTNLTPEGKSENILAETEVRELATLRAMANAFASSVLVDRLIQLRK